MHTGRIVTGRPTIGAWVSYALGAESQNLPAYIVLRTDNGLPTDGTRNWSSGFLPPRYQGVHFRHTGTPVLYLQPPSPVSDNTQKVRRELLAKLNDEHLANHPRIAPDLEARIASYEMAARMQLHAGEALDLAQETAETQAAYGIGKQPTDSYGLGDWSNAESATSKFLSKAKSGTRTPKTPRRREPVASAPINRRPRCSKTSSSAGCSTAR
jgi:hypothetical protein